MASKRREKDTIPAKKCDNNVMRQNVTIKKVALDSLEERYFKRKNNEQKKNMYPKLLGTDMAPQ